MSVLTPYPGYELQHAIQFLLYIQLFYSIWQFFRTFKYFRLPYVLVSSLWHCSDSRYKVRNLIIMRDIPQPLVDPEFSEALPRGMSSKDIDGYNKLLSFDAHSKSVYVADKSTAIHMQIVQREVHLEEAECGEAKFAAADEILWPGGHLIRRLSFDEAMDQILSGKGYETHRKFSCFFDYSSRQILSQSFVTFASIWPLILQAKSLDVWSGFVCIVVIVADVFSYWINKIWKWISYWLSRLVKWIIRSSSNRKRREYWYSFMSTISTELDCGNFWTAEASAKVMKRFPIKSNIRLDMGRLEPEFYPVPMVCGPWCSNQGGETYGFSINGVDYKLLQDDKFSAGGYSPICIVGPGNIRLEDKWSTADVSYFFGVCKECAEACVSPIKSLKESNGYCFRVQQLGQGEEMDGHCCTLEELVRGVRERSFLVCELKYYEKMFIT